ncbi:C4-dicarboxylate ABC transporter permease, partial [Staphylococcus aureus]|nr:C4-dicarboxylate ABC transporter permease [Staphylococcus aureus]
MEEKKHNKFKFKMPHTYALLMFVIFLAWLLTYIIPAGEYAREKKGDQTLVVSGTYHTVESANVNFLEIFRSIPEGLISGGEIVFYIFLVGGAFGIIHKTGAFENGVNKAMRMLGKANFLMIPLTMTIFSILGFTIGLAEET